ncbi:MAG: hypothetical protein JJ975_00560 [Bacteroidia bacterium]|nr:hypothetical protein [Bacteroidia bacterium]
MNRPNLNLTCIAFLCFFLSSTTIVKSQVVINPHPINGFQLASKDILNFDIILAGSHSVTVRYEAELSHESSGLVVQFQSRTHSIEPGVNSYNPTSFGISQSRYLNHNLSAIEKSTSFLPPGEYTYCIRLTCMDTEEACKRAFQIEQNYTACGQAHSETITPLLLNTPEDESVVEDLRPNFNWIPPMPFGNSSNLRYTFRLVNMLEGQTAEDAIRRNRAVYERTNLTTISQMFPGQLNDLRRGQRYAWQVSAYIGDVHIGTSDVWEFEIDQPKPIEYFYVVKPKLGMEAYGHPVNRKLGFVFEDRYHSDEQMDWSARIRSETSNEWFEIGQLIETNKTEGKTNLALKPEDIQDLETDITYVFEITNGKSDPFFVRIRFEDQTDQPRNH